MGVVIKQVAEAAGVSTATVSRVLTGNGYASKGAAAAVRSAADRLGYRPSAPARSLRTSRTGLVAVHVPELANPVFVPFVRGVESVASAHGFAVLVSDGQRDRAVERRQLALAAGQRVDALVLAGRPQDPGALDALRALGTVIAGPGLGGRGGYGSERAAIDAAASDLARFGHRRVLLAAASGDPGAAGTRRSGRRHQLTRALAEHGAGLDTLLVGRSLDRVELAARLERALAGRRRPTALVSSSHLLAPRLLEALGLLDVALPRELSFLTFGDSPWAAAYRPPVAAIAHDLFAEARRLTEQAVTALGRRVEVPSPAPAAPAWVPRRTIGAAADGA